jgi:hypothetical protein
MSGSVGDNVFRASGVIAAAAAGRTGTVDWITTPKVTGDSPVTGVTAKGYFLNTTAGEITLNLPAGAAGSIVSMADYAATWQTNKVTVVPNGSEKIGGVNANVALATEGQSVTLVYIDSTQGWINTMDSTSNVRGSNFITATGGTITTDGDYKVHSFTGPGTFCVSYAGSACGSNTVDYMVVAGGGGGGAGCASGGGGGAGGLRKIYPNPATGGFPISASPYSITVGGGGAGGAGSPAGTPGCKGNDSVFSTVTSTGGGLGGMGVGGTPVPRCGGDGGSGGGAGRGGNCGGAGDTPAIPAPLGGPQGTAGGPSIGAPHGGGGGGGHTAVGATGAPAIGGDGGAGTTVCISGSPTVYAGGGGGGSYPVASGQPCGGAGGGGRGAPPDSPFADMLGTDNTGGGGGGSSEAPPYSPPIGVGGTGGSGIVIIRYKFQ